MPLDMKTKKCSQCREQKQASYFYKDKSKASGLASMCKKCKDAKKNEYNRNHKDSVLARHREYDKKHRHKRIERMYGITKDEYGLVLSSQGGCCAACGAVFEQGGDRMDIDHNHKTKRFRGLLHRNCNVIIGLAHESPSVLRSIADYIEHHNVIDLDCVSVDSQKSKEVRND